MTSWRQRWAEGQGCRDHCPRDERRDRLRAGAPGTGGAPQGPVLLRCRRGHCKTHHADTRRTGTDRDHESQGLLHGLGVGRLHVFTSPIGKRLGFHEDRANILIEADGKLVGVVAEPILGKQAKVDALIDITARLGISPEDTIAVGDGANDLGMLQLAGSGVALHAKPVVSAQAKLRLDHADLTGLLYLQGYRKTDFVYP